MPARRRPLILGLVVQSNQPPRPTQPHTLCGKGNEYRPKCGDALRLGSIIAWTLTVLSKEQHVIVYIDFSKAFDVVSHPKLFARLYTYGIRGTVLTWLKNFFSSRMHQTKVGTASSDTAMLCSKGVALAHLCFWCI